MTKIILKLPREDFEANLLLLKTNSPETCRAILDSPLIKEG